MKLSVNAGLFQKVLFENQKVKFLPNVERQQLAAVLPSVQYDGS